MYFDDERPALCLLYGLASGGRRSGVSEWAICFCPEEGRGKLPPRALAAQRNFLTRKNTRNKNGLRSILLESRLVLEVLVNLSDGTQLKPMASLDGA